MTDQPEPLTRLLRKPALLAWCIYLVAQPFYIFKSGLPQPGDVLIFLLAPLALWGWNGRLGKRSIRAFRPLVWFTLWVCVVDYAWALILGEWGIYGVENFVLFPVYYIYNTLIFLLALILYHRFGDSFLRLTLWIVFGIVMFLVLASFVYIGSSARGRLFFSNPNQLGYYALLSGCLIALLQRRIGFGAIMSSVGLSGCAYLAILSASRSAVAGVALLVVFLVFSNPRVIVLASIAAIGLFLVGGPLAQAIDASHKRVLENRRPQYTFFEERGYDRILAHKEYLLLGAGEGGTGRFKETTIIGAAEIHSSAGTILFCYGIVGVVLFSIFLWRLLKGAALRASMMLVPPLLYTFAHQGLRFTLLWVLLPLFVVIKDSVQDFAKARSTPARGAAPPAVTTPPVASTPVAETT